MRQSWLAIARWAEKRLFSWKTQAIASRLRASRRRIAQRTAQRLWRVFAGERLPRVSRIPGPLLAGPQFAVPQFAGPLLAGPLLALALPVGAPLLAQTTPRILGLFPPGAGRGAEVEVALAGDYMPPGCRLVAAGSGLDVTPTSDPRRFRFRIAADAPIGPKEIRLAAAQGASAAFPFVIGESAELVHDQRRGALAVERLPVVANGRLDLAGAIDRYTLRLAAGQQVVVAIATKRIRSPLDPVMRMLDATGRVVATSLPPAEVGRGADGLLAFRAAEGGIYTLELFDFQMAGGVDYTYRLSLTDGPWIDYVWPWEVAGGSTPGNGNGTEVLVAGWNLPGGDGRLWRTTATAFPGAGAAVRAALGNESAAGWLNQQLALPASPRPVVVERESPQDATAGPQSARLPSELAVTWPVSVYGRFDVPGDVDVVTVAAKKGEQLAIELQSSQAGFPTDAVLTIRDAAGKQLIEVDDSDGTRDPKVRWAAPADGSYAIVLRDRSRQGGARNLYRLSIAAPVPDLRVRINTASLLLHPGRTTKLPVLVERRDGFAGDLELSVEGLPAGVSVAPLVVPEKSPATVEMTWETAASQAPIAGLVSVVARRKQTGESRDWTAEVAESPTGSASDRLWVAVCPEIPFTLKANSPILDAPRLAGFPFPVMVERKDGFAGAIRLIGVEPDKRGTLMPLDGRIEAGSDRGALPVVLQHQVIEGTTHRTRVMGVAEVPGADGKPYSVFHVASETLSVGCFPGLLTLSVDSPVIGWRPGTPVSVAVRIRRREGVGPVRLRVAIPDDFSGVTATAVDVPTADGEARIELAFATDARLPPRSTIELHAESSRDGLPVYAQSSLRLERQLESRESTNRRAADGIDTRDSKRETESR